ncbi:Protein of unknown function [Bacillus mycoides]|nr:Protein of unknown function [Bacillus mycoides]
MLKLEIIFVLSKHKRERFLNSS